MVVLFQQKKAWAAFAKKHKLKYEPGKMMDSPTVTGVFGERLFSLYTGVQQTDDIRGQRFVTIIEFQMGKGMPTGAAIATKDFMGFVSGLVFTQDYKPELAEWKEDYIARTRDRKNLKVYLTKERQQVLVGLFGMKNAAVLLFFDEIEAVLRIESSDPLRDVEHLDKIVNRIKQAVEVLIPTKEEKKKFKKLLAEEKKRIEEGHDDDEDDEEDEDVIEEDIVEEAVEEDAAVEEKPKKKKKKAAKKKKAQSEDEE